VIGGVANEYTQDGAAEPYEPAAPVSPQLAAQIVREAARLQSFHDGFEFKTSEWQMLKQIGNAVPPLLGRALAAAAEKALLRLDGKQVVNFQHPEPLFPEPLLLHTLAGPAAAEA
jgi:hypothetical protein